MATAREIANWWNNQRVRTLDTHMPIMVAIELAAIGITIPKGDTNHD